ncbi:hypothetical protein B0H11DRAFT_2039484 [Mycena galericulata]|nr:hypothetical protein B0H11DRAFT_2039484 [Mycena galericulata]
MPAGTTVEPNFCTMCAAILRSTPCLRPIPCMSCGTICTVMVPVHWQPPAAQPKGNTSALGQSRWRKGVTPQAAFKAKMAQATYVSNGQWKRPYVYGYANAPRNIHKTPQAQLLLPWTQRASQDHIENDVPPPPPLSRPQPPKQVVVPLVTDTEGAERPIPIVYQTLQLLLIDLNHLLCTPHENEPFGFRGTCSIIADPTVGNSDKVTSIAWDVLGLTAVSFNPNTLIVDASPSAAHAMIATCAIWMNAPRGTRIARGTLPNACSRCDHSLSIGVERCEGPLIGGKDITGFHGQRINVDLRHFAR